MKAKGKYLTLTSVVFEFNKKKDITNALVNLTLTSVVFEYFCTWNGTYVFKFNFNKCCIWITWYGKGFNH